MSARVGSVEFQAQLAAAGKQFRDAGVRYLFLLHGTFAGTDALGLFSEIARYFPEVGDSLHELGKDTLDRLLGETGNYTTDYAKTLQSALSLPSDDRALEVRRFLWSSENHHIARADAALCLLLELSQLPANNNERILLWCHSHAGNVLALLTNLLAAPAEELLRFFQASRSYRQAWLFARRDVGHWQTAEKMLRQGELHELAARLDIVTLGTPVRYGWDTDGYHRLLHFTHHHVCHENAPLLARFPPLRTDLLTGLGDFIQQVGIAGTDFPPGPVVWRSWLADVRLRRLLAPNLPRSQLLARLRLGQRVHADGHTLLVDYGPQPGTPAHHYFGHAVYTRTMWMAFHAQQIARIFYSDHQHSRPITKPIL